MDDDSEFTDAEREIIRRGMPSSVPHTLWQGAVLLADLDLYPMSEGRLSGLSGVVRPTPAFEAIRPVVEAFSTTSARFLESLRNHFQEPQAGPLTPESVPGAAEHHHAAIAMEHLGLTVRDAEGRTLEGVRVILQRHLGFQQLDDDARRSLSAVATSMEFPMLDPDCVLVSVIREVEDSPRNDPLQTEGSR